MPQIRVFTLVGLEMSSQTWSRCGSWELPNMLWGRTEPIRSPPRPTQRSVRRDFCRLSSRSLDEAQDKHGGRRCRNGRRFGALAVQSDEFLDETSHGIVLRQG